MTTIESIESARNGDNDALEQILDENDWAIEFVLTKHLRQKSLFINKDADALRAAGQVGIWRAVKKYDPTKGTKFSTYAMFYIGAELRKQMRITIGIIKIPDYVFWDTSAIMTGKKTLSDIPEETVRNTSLALKAAAPKHIESIFGLQDQYSISDLDTKMDSTERVLEFFSLLTEREKYILTKHFGLFGSDELSLRELAVGLGVTKERARQVEKIAFVKIREYLKEKNNE